MQAQHYVSITQRSERGKPRWRVRLKYFNGNLNTLDATLQEDTFRTENSAENRANDLARRFAAKILR